MLNVFLHSLPLNSSSRRKFFIALIFFLSIFLCFSFVENVNAVEYGGIGGRPAYPRSDNPRTESIFVHTAEAGDSINEGVKILNNSNEKKTVLVYAVDSEVSTGGAFACKQQSEEKKNVGSWINLDKSEVTLDPLKGETIQFTINISPNASIGEHNGCIIIQEKKEASEQAGVNLTFRSGIRVALLIPGDITRKLEIEGFEVVQRENSIRILRPKVRNLGNVSIDAEVKVKADYFFGKNYINLGGQYPILRGETSDWNFELNKPYWGGFYKTYFTVEYDANKEAGVGTRSGKDLTRLESPATWFFVFPALPALLIETLALLCIILAIFLVVRMIKQKRVVKKNWVDYKVQRGENINGVAQKFGTKWKDIATANKLKPPYNLNEGDIIKVPPQK